MNSQTKSGVNLDDFKINADLTSPNTKSIALFVDDDDGGNGRWPDFCYMQTRRRRSCPRTTSNRSETTNFNGPLATSKSPHLRKQQPKEIAFDCPETSSKSASEVPLLKSTSSQQFNLTAQGKNNRPRKQLLRGPMQRRTVLRPLPAISELLIGREGSMSAKTASLIAN